MEISEYAYELYKIDWEFDHRISGQRKLDAYREYVQFCMEEESDPLTKEYTDLTYPTFEDYLDDHGYGGELYVCYEEFLGAEYLDDGYMEYLLKEPDLLEARQLDLKKNFQMANESL